MELMVEAEALVKRFGPVRALAGIDLAVRGVRLPWCWESIVSPTRDDRQPGRNETACGVVSLRRHCPDQVPGGRRPASELSPASQPFLPAPGPRRSFSPAPSITSQTLFTLYGADDRCLGAKARSAGAKRRVSAVAAAGPCRATLPPGPDTK